MRKQFKVLWTESAERDLVEIVEHIAQESLSRAVDVLHEIREQAALLYSLPARGRIVPELQEQGITLYRELIIPPWRIAYRIAGQSIYILSMLDSRQNMEDLLLHRLVKRNFE